MPTLTRYVLLELLKAFGVVLTVMTAFMMFFTFMTELWPKDIGAAQFAGMFPFLLPEAIKGAFHGATLYSVCTVFGRMAANNELVAIKSLGISPMVLVRPALCLATLASIICVWLYDVSSSWGAAGIRRVVVESVEAIAYSTLTTRRSYSTPNLVINVKRVDGRRLVRPTLLYHPPDGAQPVTITAEEGYLRTNLRDKTLTILFCNGSVYAADDMRLDFPEKFEQVIPLARASRECSDRDWQAETMAFLSSQVEQRQRRISQLEAALRTAQREHGAHEVLLGLRRDLEAERGMVSNQRAIYHRHFANGFFCLAFAMIGIPVSILLRSGEAIKCFLVCFAPIVLVNQPLWSFSNRLSMAGEVPSQSVWFSNFVFMGVGVWLLRKAIRH